MESDPDSLEEQNVQSVGSVLVRALGGAFDFGQSLTVMDQSPIGGWPETLTAANSRKKGWGGRLAGDADVTINAKAINASQTEVLKDIGDACKLVGCDERTAILIAHSESNFHADAKNKLSSAAGVFQITTGTAQMIINRILPQELPGTPEGERILQELRTSYNPLDPRQNAILGTAFIKYNHDRISNLLGHESEAWQDYMMHFRPATAEALARNPGMMSEALPASVTAANPAFAGMTVGDLAAVFRKKMSANVDALMEIANPGSVETGPTEKISGSGKGPVVSLKLEGQGDAPQKANSKISVVNARASPLSPTLAVG